RISPPPNAVQHASTAMPTTSKSRRTATSAPDSPNANAPSRSSTSKAMSGAAPKSIPTRSPSYPHRSAPPSSRKRVPRRRGGGPPSAGSARTGAPSGPARMLVVSDWSHDVCRAPSEVFRAPYADRVEGLFDGTHDEAAIMEALPPTVEEMLTEEALSRLGDPSSPLVAALAENSRVCGGWAGGARVRHWEEFRITAEPAAAVPLAAWLAGRVPGENPCLVICGANADWRPAG